MKANGLSRSQLIIQALKAYTKPEKKVKPEKKPKFIQTDAIGRDGCKVTVNAPGGRNHALGCKCMVCQIASGKLK